MIPATLIVVAAVAVAAFGLGLTAIRRAVRHERVNRHEHPGSCGDWSPSIRLGDRDRGLSTCVLPYGHRSRVHRDAQGATWGEL